jgi:hypothetical protein
LLAPLAAMFAGLPPSSSELAERKKRCSGISSCRSAARTSLYSIARAARYDVRWVAAIFVGADGTEKALLRHLLLQIGGANIANPPLPTLAAV